MTQAEPQVQFSLKTKFLSQEMAYDGTQLRSLFAYMSEGLMGDSLVAWVGACDVSFEHMVDGEDLLEQSPIRGARMLHFIMEIFGANLREMTARQRLFSALAGEVLRESLQGKPTANRASELRREGDDLYLGAGKLSISIATVSPVSGLIHFAINVTNEGTPVQTASLSDLGLDAKLVAQSILQAMAREDQGLRDAQTKVRWVR
ncbi:MAG TPA: DUF366 family protein [Pseudobdellovibrionaceae bacterium]|nr:DUF366 family protein [Pseudobdellovibrionaceae bacterium]